MTLQQHQQQVSSLCSMEPTRKESLIIESELDFILLHFDKQEFLFPRKISTYKSNNRQFIVRSKQEIIDSFISSNLVDCKVNAYASLTDYKGIQRYKPNFIFIDLDKNNFKTSISFENVLSNILKNIREKLGYDAQPTVLETGGGYHIYQPVYCPTALENVIQFSEFDRPSEQFLRFAKDYLSNGKADKQNNPSFKSCLLRIPGSINSKYNVTVKTLQTWNGIRPPIRREFIEEFRTFLIQKKIEEQNYRQKIMQLKLKMQQNNDKNSITCRNYYYYDWIETKVLQTPISDYRKLVVGLVLVPYLVVIKKLSNEESHNIINEWLMRCDVIRKLDFDPKYLINNNIKTSMKKLILPISIYKLETNYRNLYLSLLLDQNNNNNKNNNNNNISIIDVKEEKVK
jgi:hypothetical protein